MNFFKAIFSKAKKDGFTSEHEAEMYVKRGGHLGRFTPDQVTQMQTKAMQNRDVMLYDLLDVYWTEIRWKCR